LVHIIEIGLQSGDFFLMLVTEITNVITAVTSLMIDETKTAIYSEHSLLKKDIPNHSMFRICPRGNDVLSHIGMTFRVPLCIFCFPFKKTNQFHLYVALPSYVFYKVMKSKRLCEYPIISVILAVRFYLSYRKMVCMLLTDVIVMKK